jgi:hypothetical protein
MGLLYLYLRPLACCDRGFESTGGTDVCLLRVLCVVRGLCDVLIARPEEYYRLWQVVVCNHETS